MAEKDLKMFPKEEKNDSESFLTCKEANSSVVSTTCDDQSVISLTSTDHNIGQYSTKDEVCSICIKTEQFRSATHFCTKCEPRGKYLCGSCLKNHTDFLKRHRVLSLSVDKKSKYKEKTERQVENKKEGAGSENIKRWLLADDPLYSTIGESDKTTIISDTSQTLVESSVTSRATATSDCTEIIGSDGQSLTISNMHIFDRTSSYDEYGYSGMTPEDSDLQNILRDKKFAWQARNLNSKQHKDGRKENWTSGFEHDVSGARTQKSAVTSSYDEYGYSGMRPEDSDLTYGYEHEYFGARSEDINMYERIDNVPQDMGLRQNVILRKQRLQPARSMQNINAKQTEDNPNELQNVILRKQGLQPARSMQNINAQQNEDNPNELDFDDYEVCGWRGDRHYLQNVILRKEGLQPARSMQNINAKQNENTPNELEVDDYEVCGWRDDRHYLNKRERIRPDVSYTDLMYDVEKKAYNQRDRSYSCLNHGNKRERIRPDVSYTDLMYDEEKKAYNQRDRSDPSLNHGDGVSSFKDKKEKKCIVM
ncbi:uncharacterized protein LOC132729401 isoform X2 [Ruditapes philippinarum]|uniref:uncharacterized protein LOC132729401 isoform X2 n=1 Tax=Ruditapes philippinarum TaxID=129788 RepID=UPI00295B983A|nr:uncharacterized protein LOC132729401 isoform X2 [Ruditapes philippinarum]